MNSILLVDNEQDWLDSFRRTLLQYKVAKFENIFTALNSEEAQECLANNKIDLVFLDLMLGNESGKDVLTSIKRFYPEKIVVMMTGVNDIRTAIECSKLGADDYMVKTGLVEELIASTRRIMKIRQLERENVALKEGMLSSVEDFPAFRNFITCSPRMRAIFKYLSAVAVSSYPILITGESGVGKGVLARAAAEQSRPGKPFVSVNVGGLDTQIFSDTLFGHKKGAFTGADASRMGAVQQAGDGTLFLDEIGDLPNSSQLKLLYLAQDGEYQQLGSDQSSKSRARFIFATNQDLEEKCRDGSFRRDLFYRLNTHFVHIPPLRERPEDIPLLFSYFLTEAATEFGKIIPQIPEDAPELLLEYSFPGNARQLRAICYDLAARAQDKISKADIKKYLKRVESTSANLADDIVLPTIDEAIAGLIEKAMAITDNNQTKAAAMLGVSQSTLSRRLKQ